MIEKLKAIVFLASIALRCVYGPSLTTEPPCPEPLRTCDSGIDRKCYPEAFMCDGKYDCDDKSDEPSTCQRICKSTEFTCLNGVCLPRKFLCDGQHDCGTMLGGGEDYSDESPALCHQSLKCGPNEHACASWPTCIHLSTFCDGKFDCYDGTDEHPKCSTPVESHAAQCKYGFGITDEGVICYCPDNQVFINGECVFQKACNRTEYGFPPPCTQGCTDTANGGFKCSCDDRSLKLVNESICSTSSTGTPKFVLLIDKEARVYGTKKETFPIPLKKSLVKFIFNKIPGFDASPAVCYRSDTDYTVNKLTCASLDFKKEKSFIVKTNLEFLYFIRFDPIGKNWIFSDGKNFISMCKHGDVIEKCVVLKVAIDANLIDLQIDPVAGLVFYAIPAGESKGIWKLRMRDGYEEKMPLQPATMPISLAVDYHTRTLFYLDRTLDYIHALDYDNKKRPRIVVEGHQAKLSVDLFYVEGKLYLINRQTVLAQFDVTKPRTQLMVVTDRNAKRAVGFAYLKENEFAYYSNKLCDWNGCPDLCVSIGKGRGRCVCREGEFSPCNYTWDGHTSFLLAARQRPSGVVPLSIPTEESPMAEPFGMSVFNDLKRTSALAIDQKGKRIFIFDSGRHSILVNDIGKEERTTYTLKNVASSEGMAYDYTSDIIYLTEEIKRLVVTVKLGDPVKTKVIVRGNMSIPRAIVVYSPKSFIFWGSWSENNDDEFPPKIERCKLDGTARTTLVSTNLRWVNGLTIDPVNEYLYFCDAFTNTIERVRFDGENREKVVEGENYVFHPYGLVFSNNYLYWTEFKPVFQHGAIKRVKILEDGVGPVTPIYNGSHVFELAIFDESKGLDTTFCSKDNGMCREYCFADMTCTSLCQVTCACQDGEMVTERNGTCATDETYIDPDVCDNKTEFTCHSNGRCIPKYAVCDGDKDCADGSDEEDDFCGETTCPPGNFQCDKHSCIPRQFICDGRYHCDDMTDEDTASCPPKEKHQCTALEQHCSDNSSICVLKTHWCDGFTDCPNGEDEVKCPRKPNCSPTEFRCGNGECIKLYEVCDGIVSCRDGLDEYHCRDACPSVRQFRCNNNTGPCMDMIYRCDGVVDCENGEDEDPKVCMGSINDCKRSNSFMCADGKCIRKAHVCDGFPDCVSGEDESNCPPSSCMPNDHFICASGESCIPKQLECDGVDDCGDFSDEAHCGGVYKKIVKSRCKLPSFRCKTEISLLCISDQKICDGVKDCPDGDDEGDMCTEKCDDSLAVQCGEICRPLPSGYAVCSCHEGSHMNSDKRTCSKLDVCRFGQCSQRCIKYGSLRHCICEDGYYLVEDFFTCRSTIPDDPYFLFSTRHEIKYHKENSRKSIPITTKAMGSVIGFDYKFNTNGSLTLYWTGQTANCLYVGILEESVVKYQRTLSCYGIPESESIAVDWVTGNIYWVDSGRIEVMSEDGLNRATLITKNSSNIRSLTLDPASGLMFWTDWERGNPRIERSTMAGNSRRVIFNVSSLADGGWPNGLVADIPAKRLYWVDGLSHSVNTVDYDGGDHQEVHRNHELTRRPYGIDVYESRVYFSDWESASILSVDKFGRDHYIEVITISPVQLFVVKVVHPSRQPRNIKNPCAGVKCSGICLQDSVHEYKCVCPPDTIPNASGECEKSSEFAVFGIGNEAFISYSPFTPDDTLHKIFTGNDFISVNKLAAVRDKVMVLEGSGGIAYSFNVTTRDKAENMNHGVYNYVLSITTSAKTEVIYQWKTFKDRKDLFPTHSSSVLEATNVEGTMKDTLMERVSEEGFTHFVYLSSGNLAWIDNKNNLIVYPSMESHENPEGLLKDAFNLMDDVFNENSVLWLKKYESNVTGLIGYNYKTKKLDKFDIGRADEIVAAAFVSEKGIFTLMPDGSKNCLLIQHEYNGKSIGSRKILQRYNIECRTRSHLLFSKYKTSDKFECKDGHLPGVKKETCVRATHGDVSKQLFALTDAGVTSVSLVGPDDQKNETLLEVTEIDGSSVGLIAVDSKRQLIYLATEKNNVYQANFDGTNRKRIYVGGLETVTSIAVDLSTGNILLALSCVCAPPVGSIFILDPTKPEAEIKALVAVEEEAVYDLVIDPSQGQIFWKTGTALKTALVDGTQNKTLDVAKVLSVVLDRLKSRVCYVDFEHRRRIACSNYDGSDQKVLFGLTKGDGELISRFTIEGDDMLVDHINHRVGFIHLKRTSKGDFKRVGSVRRSIDKTPRDLELMIADLKVPFTSCSINNGGCEHLCIKAGTTKKCICVHSKLADDGTCIPEETMIAIATGKKIEFASIPKVSDKIGEKSPTAAPLKPITTKECRMGKPMVLAVDNIRKRIFFADYDTSTIKVVGFDGSNCTVVGRDITGVLGMAYDEIHDELFVRTSVPPSIIRLSVPRRSYEVVVDLTTRHYQPQDIAVDPCRMLIYFTDTAMGIESIHYSGYKRTTVVDSDYHKVFGISIDFTTDKIYFTDVVRGRLMRCDTDGSHMEVVSDKMATHLVEVYKDYILYTDSVSLMIDMYDKLLPGNATRLTRNGLKAKSAAIISNDFPTCKLNLCNKEELGCDDACRLTAAGVPECTCNKNRRLNADNKTCIGDDASTQCTKDEFACLNSQYCLAYEETCDGVQDCAHGDDEDDRYCAARTCREGYFTCGNGRCVPEKKKCNRINDCMNYADEIDCICTSDELQCANGICIPGDMACDRKKDCADGSDEEHCPPVNCSKVVKDSVLKKCKTTNECIHPAWLCDGKLDCSDGSDESDCPSYDPLGRGTNRTVTCQPAEFKCNSSNTCIPPRWVCDGSKDCADGSDESRCVNYCSPKFEYTCKETNDCIGLDQVCDGRTDCLHGDDEKKCDKIDCNIKGNATFWCKTNRCIPLVWVCDGTDDCMDNTETIGSDEMNCKGKTGPSDVCESGSCDVPCELTAVICNGIEDCDYGVDEDNLGNRECAENEWMCDSGQCIPLSKVCDRTVDCYDNSDEFAGVCALGLDNPTNFCGFECTFHNGTVGCAEHVLCDSIEDCNDGRDELRCRYRNTNKCFHVRCPDMCLGGPYERCACSEGFYLSPFDRRTCVGKPSCARANCSQICDDHETLGHACLCVDGYSLMENEVDCKMTAESTPYLVLATGHSIKVYTTAGHLEDVPSSSLTKPVAVDFDYQTETLYFIDIHSSSNRLMTMSLFSGKTEVVKVISKFPSRGVDGLAVDWLGRNIYYTDRHKETISMCNLDGHYHKVLLRGDPLIDPRAIVVDPHNGWLFWTDWGTTAHIGRMKMNGEGVEILIQDRTIVWPNALAVDPPASRLYFGDAHRDYIGYCSYDGTRRRILTKMAGKHIFAMSVFENYLYWTDWSSRTVEKVHKIAGENKDLVVHQMKKRPMGIKVFHPPFGFTNNTKDVCVKAGCDNLCAPIGDNKVACICAEGFRAEGKRCVSDCSPLDLVCRNTYKCIPKWWECDGQDDCGDAEDEFFYEKGKCEPFPCQPGQFKCTENEKNATTCLYTSMLCDGHDDCPNRDDELLSFCQHYKCSESQMKCADGSRCVPLTKVCDGRWDCEDGSDEVKCQNCGAGFFTCLKHSEHSNVTTCIVEEKYCDGHKDCPMGEDEPVSCPINYKACTTHQFQCENSECIGHERLCDGIKDCGDGEDEERCDYVCLARCHNKCFDYIDVCNGEIDRPECNGIDESHEACERKFAMHTDAWTAICTHNGGKACPNYNSCYQKSEKCDQIVQCHDDGADEVGCGRTCSSPNVLCKNGLGCVKPDQVCDGVADCTDGSDEISCYRVGLDDVKTTRQWVMAERMCDGVLDTFDGSDESDAACVNRTACPFPMLFCKDKRQCFVGLMGICDRVVDCADGFDESEHSCHMQNWIDTNEKDRSFQCNNGRYISIKERCDGKENCADGSDEDSCGSGCDVVGVCTQKCRQDSHNRTYCYCAPGYEQRQQNGACHPYGMSADIFISLTTHIEWFFMPQETSLHPTKMPPLKVSATTGIDIGFTYDNLTVMYTRAGADGHAKVSEVSPSKHLRSQIITDDLEELLPPEYTKKIVNAPIAVDHVHKNVYFADPADASYPNSYHHIFVTHPGSWNRAIVVYSVGTITSLAVAPNANRLFWTLTYPRAAIYSSELSGRTDHFLSKNGLKREPILTRNIYRPTSLTVDEPNGRIYWIEQGRRQIVSCRFDGKEVVTKRFDFNFAPLVMDLHVDELFVLFSTRRSMKDTKDTKTPLAELWAVHKFTGARRFLEITASEAATALKVAHSGNRHPFTSPFLTEFHANCTKCPEMAVCLPTTQKDNVSIEAECKCTMGTRYSRSKKDCTYYHMKVSPHSPMGAYTQCRRPFQCYNGATCNLKTNKCDCDRTRFAGDYCEVIPCFVDCASSLRCGAKESVGLARQCICPEFQKGETCAINLCDDQCGQHGKCVVNEDYGDTRYKLEEQDRVYCHCDIGWHGVRCQNGPWELFCNMQGQMVEVENQEVECICKSGRRGPRCQHCAELECQNNGVCAETAEGPVCKCPRGFGGVHCELDMCNGTCTTVEKCDYNPATPEIPAKCVCTPAAGHQTKDCQPMCGKNVNWCLFGGTCVDLVGQPGTCICPPRYTGARCEQKLECSEYCLNNGTCSITNSTHYTCDCPLTHFGDRCESAKGCELVCENGGTCVLDERADAHCKCPRGLGGESCEELIATSCESLECSNDAECTNLEEYGPPVCICKQGWHGSTCLLRECTPTYCYNQGKCFMENEFPKCRCPANFSGYQCEVDESKIFHASYGTYALLVGVMILSSITVCLCVRCLTAENGQQERMEDVPMQDLSEHVDQEAVLGDERASFINPAFDSLSVAFSVSDDTVRLLDHPVGPSCEEEEEEEEGGGGGEGAEEDSDITPNPVDPSL